MQRASQAHHLGVAVGYFGLDYEEVEIATGARFSARVRAKRITRTGDPAVSASVRAARSMSSSMRITLADGADRRVVKRRQVPNGFD